jgi:hypothetical protein
MMSFHGQQTTTHEAKLIMTTMFDYGSVIIYGGGGNKEKCFSW